MEKDDKPQKIGNNSEISKISNDVVPYKFDTSSIETYIQLENLADKLEKVGYKSVHFEQCYTMKKNTSDGLKDFPLFLMTAIR